MKTVMIVDDNTDIASIVSEILTGKGFQAIHCANGKIAFDYLNSDRPRPCLILLDLCMPVMTGWEFLAKAEHEGLLSQVNIQIISAQGRNNVPKEISFLAKPFGIEDLVAIVEKCCGK